MLYLLLEAKAFHLIGETPLFLENGQNDHKQIENYSPYDKLNGAICFAKELKGGNDVYTDYRSNAFMG